MVGKPVKSRASGADSSIEPFDSLDHPAGHQATRPREEKASSRDFVPGSGAVGDLFVLLLWDIVVMDDAYAPLPTGGHTSSCTPSDLYWKVLADISEGMLYESF